MDLNSRADLQIAGHAVGQLLGVVTQGSGFRRTLCNGNVATETDLQVAGHVVRQLLGVLRNLVVQVDGGGVLQPLLLLLYGCQHLSNT